MNKLERISELREIIDKARGELNSLEAEERNAANASSIGKCYRYRNSNGGGENWWLYMKVLRTEDGHLIGHKFQTQPGGNIDIEPEYPVYFDMSGGWEQIAERDFHRAWTECQEMVAALPKP